VGDDDNHLIIPLVVDFAYRVAKKGNSWWRWMNPDDYCAACRAKGYEAEMDIWRWGGVLWCLSDDNGRRPMRCCAPLQPSQVCPLTPLQLCAAKYSNPSSVSFTKVPLQKNIHRRLLLPLSDAKCDAVCWTHPALIQRHHVSTADVVSLKGHLVQLPIAASNQMYPSLCLHLQERTLSNDVVILSW